MAGLKSLLKKPMGRTLLFVALPLLLYIFQSRPADLVSGMQVVGNRILLASGKTGITVLDVSDEGVPTKIQGYNTRGKANALQVIGDQAYVADGSNGLLILSLGIDQSIIGEIARIDTPGKALDVSVLGNYIYLADSKEDVVILDGANVVRTIKLAGKGKLVRAKGNSLYIANDRGRLFIFDISDPGNPQPLGEFDAPADINDIRIYDRYALLALDQVGLMVLDVSNPENITRVTTFGTQGNAKDIVLRGSYAYIAADSGGFVILDIANINAITLLGWEGTALQANQIEVKGDTVYVADGRDGLRAIQSPIKFNFNDQDAIEQAGLFEDVTVKGSLAYVAAGPMGLRIVNVENPGAPKLTNFRDNVNDYAMAVTTEGDSVYVVYQNEGIYSYDISGNPERPQVRDSLEIPGQALDVYVWDRTAYVAAGDQGLQIISFQEMPPALVGSVDTPGNAQGVFLVGSTIYLADGGSGLQIISVADKSQPFILSSLDTPGDSVAVSASREVLSDEEKTIRTSAYLADSANGLVIVDVSDPTQPIQLANYQTEEAVNDVAAFGSIIYLAERKSGLMILDAAQPQDITLLASQDTPGSATGLFLSGTLVYVADLERGLRVIDGANLTDPVELGFYDAPVQANALKIRSNYGYLVDGKTGMWILDVSNPKKPAALRFLPTPGDALDLTLEGDFAYIADSQEGISVVDISDPLKPSIVGSYRTLKSTLSVDVQGDYAYVAGGETGIHILNIADLSNIYEVFTIPSQSPVYDVDVAGDYAFVAAGEAGLKVYNIANPFQPVEIRINRDLNLKDSIDVKVLGNQTHVLVADGANGFFAFDFSKIESPDLLGRRDTNGIARNIDTEGDYAFVACDGYGIFVFYIYDLKDIRNVGTYEFPQVEGQPVQHALSVAAISQNAAAERIKRFYIYLAMGENLFEVYDAQGSAQLSYRGMYEFPGEATLRQFYQEFILRLSTLIQNLFTQGSLLLQDKIIRRIQYLGYGLLVFWLIGPLWLFLFSYFVLPIRTIKEWLNVNFRLREYMAGTHGPAVFVKGGEIIEKAGETQRRGYGVARVDLNSALVLESRPFWKGRQSWSYRRSLRRSQRSGNPFERVRVEGPGIVFTEPYEKIRGAADLRQQFRIRPEVHAYTRDGIEVRTFVWVIFTLGEPPEVFDVAYDGEKEAENIRVVYWGEDIQEEGNKKYRVKVVKQLVDQLDPEDRNEVHRFVQKQKLPRFLENVCRLLDQSSDLPTIHSQLDELAHNLGLSGDDHVERILTALQLSETDQGVRDRSLLERDLRRTLFDLETPNRDEFLQYTQEARRRTYLRKIGELAEETAEGSEFRNKVFAFLGESISLDISESDDFYKSALELAAIAKRDTSLEGLERSNKLKQWNRELFVIDYPEPGPYIKISRLLQISTQILEIVEQMKVGEKTGLLDILNGFLRILLDKIQSVAGDFHKKGNDEFDRLVELANLRNFARIVQDNYHKVKISVEDIDAEQENHAAFQQKLDQKSRDAHNEVRLLAFTLDTSPQAKFHRYTQRMKDWAAALKDNDRAGLSNFTKQVQRLVDDLGEKDSVLARSFIRRCRGEVSNLRKSLNRFETLAKIQLLKEAPVIKERIKEIRNLLREIGRTRKSREQSGKVEEQWTGPFLFNRKRVFSAIYSEAQDAQNQDETMPWSDLPAHAAAQTLRNILAKEIYDYIYEPGKPDEFNLYQLKSNLANALKNQGIMAHRFVEGPQGQPLFEGQKWREGELKFYSKVEFKTPKVLRKRGIKIVRAGFPDLIPVSPRVRRLLLENWLARWEKESMEVRATHELQATRIINHARALAQRDMAYTLSSILDDAKSEEVLAMRVFQALENAAADPATSQLLPRDTIYMLRSLKQWFLPDGEGDSLWDGFEPPTDDGLLPP
jgi:hypothetical protein